MCSFILTSVLFPNSPTLPLLLPIPALQLRILHARTLKIGGDVELEFLAMRINFSGYFSQGLEGLTSAAAAMQQQQH